MLTDLELMNKQVRALFTEDQNSRLLFVNEPAGSKLSPAPRLFLGLTRSGNVWRFRADLPENLCGELEVLCTTEAPINADFNEPPRHFEKYIRLLENYAPIENVLSGPAFQFTRYETSSKNCLVVTENNAEILKGGFEDFIDELPAWQPFAALVEENRAVSVCRSVRITPEAHEAGVETLPIFRGNGYAKEVVIEWARLVRDAGAIPLYSTSWENTASQAVARKLGLNCYGTDFQIN